MFVHENGYWIGDGNELFKEHDFDSDLAAELINFFRREHTLSIVDFGCGLGEYVKVLKQNNFQVCGFDGNPNTPKLTDGLCSIMDLSKPIILDTKFDWVLSLEVGEHLPSQFEDIFIENLHKNNTKGIVCSWAIKGQGGLGHVNCQNNDYIKDRFSKLGYKNDIESENKMRNKSKLPWFKNTIMVFKK